jgi:hypothetical protein
LLQVAVCSKSRVSQFRLLGTEEMKITGGKIGPVGRGLPNLPAAALCEVHLEARVQEIFISLDLLRNTGMATDFQQIPT